MSICFRQTNRSCPHLGKLENNFRCREIHTHAKTQFYDGPRQQMSPERLERKTESEIYGTE